MSMLMAWSALYCSAFYLVVAATVALVVGTINTIIGMVLATALYGAVNWVISGYSSRTGLTVALFSRSVFGYFGAALVALVYGLVMVYFAVFESSVIAVVFQDYFGGPPLWVWYLIVAVYSSVFVLGGVRVWLDKFNAVLLPLYFVGLVAAILWAGSAHGFSLDFLTYRPDSQPDLAGPGWLFALSVYMGVMSLMLNTWDFARFGRREDATFHGLVTFGPVSYALIWIVNGIAGLYLALTVPRQGDLTETSGVLALVSLMGLAGVAFIWVTQTKINTANYYLASTNWQSFFARTLKLRWPRTVWVALVGVAVFLLMLTDIFSYLLQSLQVFAVLVVSWVAIALTHIAYDRVRDGSAREPEFRPGRVPLVNFAGTGSWILSSGIGLYVLYGTGTFGSTWSPIVTVVVSALTYWLAVRFAPRGWLVMDRPFDPRQEVDDPWEARVRCHNCDRSYLALEMDRDPASSHEPICAECATVSTDFYRAASSERSMPLVTGDEQQRESTSV